MVFLACTPSKQRVEEAPPPQIIVQLTRDLQEAGIPTKAERLQSLREFPGCEDAQFRYRLRFSGDFVNVSRFETEAEARARLGEFRNTVLKAGELASEHGELRVTRNLLHPIEPRLDLWPLAQVVVVHHV